MITASNRTFPDQLNIYLVKPSVHCQRMVHTQFLKVILSRKSSVIVCVCVCVCMSVCARVCVCETQICAHTHTHMCVHACVYVCVRVCSASLCTPYVTGFWKTDRNVTPGQLLFIGPANSHTYTLSMHCWNTRLSYLVCFSRADFADHVKSRLRQWDPWRALDGRYGSDIHRCVNETSHRPSRLVKAYN